jgi:hypothetical protein
VELRNTIAARFEADLPATLTFDYPSLAAIAAFLAAERAAFLAEHLSSGTTGGSGRAAQGYASDAELSLQPWEGSQPELPLATELVAVSGRYPKPLAGSSSLLGGSTGASAGGAGFWAGMRESADLQAVVPLSRWDMDAIYAPDLGADRMTIYARFGAFCRGVDAFDAAAFRLAATEALAVDPQVRWVGDMEQLQGRRACRQTV